MKVVMLSIGRDFFSVCTRVESTFRKQISAPAFPLLTKNSYSRRPWNRHFYFGKMSLTHMAGSCFSDFFLLSAKFSLTDDCSFFNLFILGSIVEGTCRIRQIRVSFSRRESYREQQVWPAQWPWQILAILKISFLAFFSWKFFWRIRARLLSS